MGGMASFAKGLVEQIGIHVGLEVTAVAVIDQLVANVFVSMLCGIALVEGTQALWRRSRVHSGNKEMN